MLPAVLKSAVQSANTAIFVPSSFDFISVHDYFRKQSGVTFAVLSEWIFLHTSDFGTCSYDYGFSDIPQTRTFPVLVKPSLTVPSPFFLSANAFISTEGFIFLRFHPYFIFNESLDVHTGTKFEASAIWYFMVPPIIHSFTLNSFPTRFWTTMSRQQT